MNLKELSELLGLSQTTVSRALNGYPEVSEETRKRVAEAARVHDYRPNARAKSLATGRAHAIGHVLPKNRGGGMMNPIFGDFVAGACEVYAANGYELTVSVVDEGEDETAYRRMKALGMVDGVVVHAPQMEDKRIALLQELGLPFVVHGRASGVTSPYNWVDVDNRRAFQKATELLLDLGHRRIALLNGNESMDFAYRRRKGYETALTERRVAIDPTIMTTGHMTEDAGYSDARAMLSRENSPTAFLVSSMFLALGVRHAIEDAGLSLGKDVSIVTHDDEVSYLRNGGTVPVYTATRSSVYVAGKHTAQMLIDQIRKPLAAPQNLLLPAQLVLGRSTGPVQPQVM